MNKKLAKQCGGKHAFRSAFYIVLLLASILLIQQTRGDFANGILFFFEIAFHPIFLAMIAGILGISYLLGRNTGIRLLVYKKSIWKSVAINSIISSVTSGLILFVGLIFKNIQEKESAEFFLPRGDKFFVLQFTIFLFVLMIFGWTLACNRIKNSTSIST